MTDVQHTPPPTHTTAESSRTSVPALVTYWLLAIWSGMVIAVFLMASNDVKIEGVMLAVITGLIGTQTTLLVAAVSFWVGTTYGAKAGAEREADNGRLASAALAQLAGAGPPPPSTPLAPEPAAQDAVSTRYAANYTPARP